MSTFKSTQRTINADIQTVYDKLSNPGSFSGMAEKAQEELKAQVKDIHFSNDTITLNVNPVGAVELKITERQAPNLIRLETAQSPLPFALTVNLQPASAVTTTVEAEVKMDLNPIVKQMVAKPLQAGLDKFAELLTHIPYTSL